jgi:hypothetical protein
VRRRRTGKCDERQHRCSQSSMMGVLQRVSEWQE